MPSFGDLLAGLLRLRNPELDAPVRALIQYYQLRAADPADAFFRAKMDRHVSDEQARERGTARDLALRDAEHALFAQYLMNSSGGMDLLMTVPAYSATKAIGQSLPRGSPLDRFWQGPLHLPGHGSTPPDLQEIRWGLAPLLGGMPKNTPGALGP